MSNLKKNILLLASTLIASACAVGLLLQSGAFPFNIEALYRNSVGNHSVISYHLADDASKGEITDGAVYTVTDPTTKYYYTGYVSKGVFSSSGLALVTDEYFQADLKGGSSVQISFSSGAFAIELSNDNSHFSSGKYLATNGTYTFHTLMRYIRVLCKTAGTLTDVNIGCECSDNYTLDTELAMSESAWTSTVKTNRLTLVGKQKGSNLDDLNYHNVVATRDSEGIYFYVKEKVSNTYYDSTGSFDGHWYGKDNFEVHFSSNGAWNNQYMLYASLEATDCGNFDVVMTKTHDRYKTFDCFVTVMYKCFASYTLLNEISGGSFNSSSDIYLWYGSRSNDTVFDSVSFWNNASQIKLTTNGIESLSGGLYGTATSRKGGWNDTANWYHVADDLTSSGRMVLATHVEGAIDRDKNNWGDYCWAGPLSILPKNGDLEARTVFRMDWWGWNDKYTPNDIDKGSSWAAEEAKATNGNTQFYETIIDCEIVYVYTYDLSNNKYTSLRIIFPNNPDVVTRGDYLLFQRVTTTEKLGAYVNAEYTNTVYYNK